MAKHKVNIKTEEQYQDIMAEIDALMKKGEEALSSREASKLRELALAAQGYEKRLYTIPPPQTLEGIIELKMFEHRLTQKALAKLLGMGEAKVSQILNRKRSPDVAFLKAAHQKLGIDGNLLLAYASFILPVVCGLLAAFILGGIYSAPLLQSAGV